MTIINGGYKEYKLDNGLVVALQNTPTQTIAAKLRVNFGSSHEKEGEEGMAHFLEHCLVTGGSSKFDPIQADEVRGTFGYSNAYTNIGRTFFIGEMLSEDLERWLDYTSEHVLRPRFDSDRIDGERERVLREISDAKSNHMHPVSIEYNNVFYRGHPKGRFILGKEEVVKTADKEKLSRFHSRGYNPNNMDLIVVGGLSANIKELVQNYFGRDSVGENTRKDFPYLQPLHERVILVRPAPERLNVDNPEESSAQIFLSYLGPISGHEEDYAVRTMNQILGGDTNSLLFQNIGLKKGLAYCAQTSTHGGYNACELGINATVPAKRIDEAIGAIFEEIKRMKTERVNDKAVGRIRRMAKYKLAKAFESNEGHISAIEGKLDEGITPESFIKGYDRVTPEKVIEVANKYLPDREKGKYILYIRDPLKQ
ncbi:MAG: pitrilysin family protein [Patescibacteria group bacterium]